MPRLHRRPAASPAVDVGREGPRDGDAVDPAATDPGFITADDFDATGILAGVDTCASSYWWVAELQSAPAAAALTAAETAAPGPNAPALPTRHQAARRSTSRSSTAAA